MDSVDITIHRIYKPMKELIANVIYFLKSSTLFLFHQELIIAFQYRGRLYTHHNKLCEFMKLSWNSKQYILLIRTMISNFP